MTLDDTKNQCEIKIIIKTLIFIKTKISVFYVFQMQITCNEKKFKKNVIKD